MVTLCKRRKGLCKKAQEFHKLTGANIVVLVFSSTGNPYVHGFPSFPATVDHFLHATQGHTLANHLPCATPTNAPADHHLRATLCNAPVDHLLLTNRRDVPFDYLLHANPSNAPVDHLLLATPGSTLTDHGGAIELWRQVIHLIDDQVGSCVDLQKLTAMKSNLEMLKETMSFFASFAE